MASLAAHQPGVGGRVIVEQVHVAGLKNMAALVEKHNIAFNASNAYKSLGLWVDQEISRRKNDSLASDEDEPERNLVMTRSGKFNKQHLELILGASKEYQLSVISRLFEELPLSENDITALKLCTRATPRILLNIKSLGDVAYAQNVGERAIHLALHGHIDPQRMIDLLNRNMNATHANMILTGFIIPEARGMVADNLGRGLLCNDIDDEQVAPIILDHMIGHLNAMASDEERSRWLQAMADSTAGNLQKLHETLGINVRTAVLIPKIMSHFAHIDPKPLITLLSQAKDLTLITPEGASLQSIIYDAFFPSFEPLHTSKMEKLSPGFNPVRLVEEGLVEPLAGSHYLFSPFDLARLPDAVKRPLAEFMVGVLCDPDFRAAQKIEITETLAQKIVDARMLTRRHWRMISENEEACSMICKARLSPGILEVVGERLQEMALGSALGL